MLPRLLMILGTAASILAGGCTKTAPPGAEAEAEVAEVANTCDSALRAELMAALDSYCAYEPSLAKEGLAASPDPAAPYTIDRPYLVLMPEGVEGGSLSPFIPPTEYVETWVEPRQLFGAAIVADTPAKEVASLLQALRDKGITTGALQLAKPRTVPRPAPPDPAEAARIQGSKSGVEAYGALVGCIDWVGFHSAGSTLVADQRCTFAREVGADTWMGCGCPGSVSAFKQHLYEFVISRRSTEATPAAIDFVIDESAALVAAPTTTWGELVQRLPEARPIPLWITIEGE